jgi:hypothetical protein
MQITKPVRSPEIIVKEVGSETLLYSNHAGAIHILNPTAKLIWQLCDGNHTLEDMKQKITSSFSVDAGYDIMKDIKQTLENFNEKQLLETL